ncbi:hypothetical protein [Polyangium sp. 6x1]|uniref:hypothetical protein n=1 Tax=Polyangium sp. 6x1 TaxID=3042689 RepID=UPI00248283AE|nr:hypothetical protein [Polyangium sp. 6x1]MDI1448039.1 hypothetical protein [Polyangium sp. 6x1]
MPAALSMPEDRKPLKDWITEIEAAVNKAGINLDVKTRWANLKGQGLKDGAWHKSVKEDVVVPYNVIHGNWAGTKAIGNKNYPGLPKDKAKGSPHFVVGKIMPGGIESILANFSNITKGVFKNLWRDGGSGGRGTEVFGTVTLDHKRIGAGRATDRLWYLPNSPYTAYLVSGHVDNTQNGQAELGRITNLITGWQNVAAIDVAYLHLTNTVSSLYVLT